MLHEAIVDLFSSRKELASQLLEIGFKQQIPRHTWITEEPGEFTDINPTEYRSDRVFVLRDEEQKPLLAIVLEVQLRPKRRRRYTWPVYAASLRARLECPVCILVVTPIQKTAAWARKPIDMGWGNVCTPWVPAREHIPEVLDEPAIPGPPRLRPERRSLEACAHSLCVNPGMDQRIHSGSIARAASTPPMSATSHPD